jgi:hypothetical protein
MQTDKQNNESSGATEPEKVVEAESSSESVDSLEHTETKSGPNLLVSFFSGIWSAIVDHQIIYKVITLLFALLVFSFVYLHMEGHRSILTYMGLMLLMVLVYVEILIIRDHLWVIEGSMREARRWRDVFFNRSTLRRQKLRKVFSVLFALGIFSYVYMKVPRANSPVLSFMGVILMITMLYYEILTIRDDVLLMRQALTQHLNEGMEDAHRKAEYEKFINGASDTAATAAATSVDSESNTNKELPGEDSPENDASKRQ